jgi:hypothetical protein
VPKLEEMILEIEDLRSKMEAELREASRLRQVSRKIIRIGNVEIPL